MDWMQVKPDAGTRFRHLLRFIRAALFRKRNGDRLTEWMTRRIENDFRAFGCECLPQDKGRDVLPGRSGRETEGCR